MDFNTANIFTKDTAENEKADATFRIFSFSFNVIIAGVLSIVGTVCNTLCFLTLQQDRHKLSMSILLQGLAVSDTLFLMYTFLYTTLRSIYPFTGKFKSYYDMSPYVVAYVLPFGWIAQTATILIIVLVTLDRYIAICRPFQAKQWCTIRRARKAVIAVWVVSILFNFPRFFYYHHMSFGSSDTNHTSEMAETFVAHNQFNGDFWQKYRTVYHIGLTITFLFVIPLPILIVLNLKLLKEIANARKRQLMLMGTKNERDKLAVTVNLLAVVTVFIVCETPDFIATIITLDHMQLDETAVDYFLCIKEILLVVSRAANFVIYCLFYSKFRRLLKILLCRRFMESDPLLSITDHDKRVVSQDSPDEQELKRMLNRERDSPFKDGNSHTLMYTKA